MHRVHIYVSWYSLRLMPSHTEHWSGPIRVVPWAMFPGCIHPLRQNSLPLRTTPAKLRTRPSGFDHHHSCLVPGIPWVSSRLAHCNGSWSCGGLFLESVAGLLTHSVGSRVTQSQLCGLCGVQSVPSSHVHHLKHSDVHNKIRCWACCISVVWHISLVNFDKKKHLQRGLTRTSQRSHKSMGW